MRTPATDARSGQGLPWLWLSIGLLTLVLNAGCQNQRQELLESDLRNKIQRIDELEKERARLKGEVGQLESELFAQQRCAAKAPQPTGATIIVKKITLGRLTGGYRKDPNITYDDALQILLEPRDSDNASVKAPGFVHIDAYEVTPEGLKAPLSGWDLTAGELRRLWDTPLIGGPAYRIELPWKAWPTTEKLKLVVRFTTLDGQAFEAEKEVEIRLPERRIKGQTTVIPSPPLGLNGPPLPSDAHPVLPPPTPSDRSPLMLPDCPPPTAPLPPSPRQSESVTPSNAWRPVGQNQVIAPANIEPQFVPPGPPTPPSESNRPRIRLLSPVGKQPGT